MEPLTGWSKFRLCAGGFFCLLNGIGVASGRSDLGGFVVGVAISAGISFVIAYAVNRKNWNGFSKWFFWISLIVGALAAGGRRS